MHISGAPPMMHDIKQGGNRRVRWMCVVSCCFFHPFLLTSLRSAKPFLRTRQVKEQRGTYNPSNQTRTDRALRNAYQISQPVWRDIPRAPSVRDWFDIGAWPKRATCSL